MSITVYGLKQCDTCKKARKWLDESGIAHQFIDYREQPIAPEQILAWARQVDWPTLVNRASTTWRQLDPARKDPRSDGEWLALLEAFPVLMRRPVLVSAKGVQFGFKPKQVADLL